jgi:flavodoxin I
MKKILLVWGSQTGNTRNAAAMIAEEFGREALDIFEITDIALPRLLEYDSLIIGTSTWGAGELQDDWHRVYRGFDSLDFTGKTVAFFGLGDQLSYSDWYLDAMGTLHDKFVERGANVVGAWPADNYMCSASKALSHGVFVGLALDADNQEHLSGDRIRNWVATIKPHLV